MTPPFTLKFSDMQSSAKLLGPVRVCRRKFTSLHSVPTVPCAHVATVVKDQSWIAATPVLAMIASHVHAPYGVRPSNHLAQQPQTIGANMLESQP